jgi:hypothetical protein
MSLILRRLAGSLVSHFRGTPDYCELIMSLRSRDFSNNDKILTRLINENDEEDVARVPDRLPPTTETTPELRAQTELSGHVFRAVTSQRRHTKHRRHTTSILPSLQKGPPGVRM